MGSLDPVFCKAAPCMCFIEALFPVTLPRPLQTTVEVPVYTQIGNKVAGVVSNRLDHFDN